MNKQTLLDAISFIDIDPKDFNLEDQYFTSTYFAHHRKHGKGHIYRVMLGCALLAKELQEPRLGKLAFCAGFLHDQNRVNNGDDRNHGLRAATQNFPKFDTLWDKLELSPIEREYVRAACADHSPNDGHKYKQNREVTNIVRDADALDRCRFFRHGRLDPKYLQYQKESRKLIPMIEDICKPTNVGIDQAVSLEEFIDRACSPAAPVTTYSREYAPDLIKDLEPGQIFVFNNDSQGKSKARTAVGARKYHGAVMGYAEGLTGEAYSIPTDGTLADITIRVENFIKFAKVNPKLEFLVSKIGCGQAGFNESQIAPLFKDALLVTNILLPKDFVDILIN